MRFQKSENEQPSYLSQRYAWRQKPALPLHKDILLYPRVSTEKQRGNVSSELQLKEDGELMRIAHELGWLYESEWTPGCGKGKIRQFPQDMAVSGRLRMEDRVGFQLMLHAIIAGEAGAVLCIEVDRLFRDKYGQESGKFIEICEKYGVIVITPRQIYDFHNPNDISDFKEDVARAWDYMQRQVYDKMIYAQEFLRATGRVGRGQRISVGYILDTDKRSPTYRHLIPYPPHAEIKRKLYVRYQELGNSLGRLYQEIKAKPFLFPDFPPDFDPRHAQAINLTKVPGGWTIGSRSGITRMLCDVTNIGWMRRGNDVVRNDDGSPKVCHEPIVPEDLFWYVFRRHARYLPSGELNPDTQRWRERKRIVPVDAMLRPVVASREPARYRVIVTTRTKAGKRTSEGHYSFYNPQEVKNKGVNTMYASIAAQEVDKVFWQLLLPHIEATADIKRYAKQEENAIESREREHMEILAQIEACDAAIARQQAKLLKVDQDKLIEAINEEVGRQEEEKARLQARLQDFLTGDTKYAEQMLEWNRLLASHVETIRPLIQKQPRMIPEIIQSAKALASNEPASDTSRKLASIVEDIQQLAATFAPKVTLELLSPRILRMVVHWRVPAWGCEESVWLLAESHSGHWRKDERAQLAELVGKVSTLELLQTLKTRSWLAIYTQVRLAKMFGLLPYVGPLSSEFNDWHDRLSWQDWQYVQEYKLAPGKVHAIPIVCPNEHQS